MGNHDHFIAVGGAGFIPVRRSRNSGVIAGRQVLDRHIGGVVGIHEGFQKRVARQTVGAMQAGTGRFTDGVEPADVGTAGHIRNNAAAHVVGRRDHWDRICRHIDS